MTGMGRTAVSLHPLWAKMTGRDATAARAVARFESWNRSVRATRGLQTRTYRNSEIHTYERAFHQAGHIG